MRRIIKIEGVCRDDYCTKCDRCILCYVYEHETTYNPQKRIFLPTLCDGFTTLSSYEVDGKRKKIRRYLAPPLDEDYEVKTLFESKLQVLS